MAGRGIGRAIRALVALTCSALLAACAHPISGKVTGNQTAIKAMTFNVRLDIASDGQNAWFHRRDLVTGLIQYEAPDILGMQEVLLRQKRDLETALPAYALVGVARDDGKESGEFSPLAFRRDRFRLIQSGTFWLSTTPQFPSKAWDAALPRIATWARLHERQSGRVILVINTHFDHVGSIARMESAKLLRSWLNDNREPGDAAILLGDFNSDTHSAPYLELTANSSDKIALSDSLAASRTAHFGPKGTFNAFKIDQSPATPIDHIFVSGDFSVLSHATLTYQFGGRLPSDHYPVLANLKLKGR